MSVSETMRLYSCNIHTIKLRKFCLSKTTTKKTAVGKRAIPQVIFSNKELQPITTMYFQWTSCEQDWNLESAVPSLLSLLENNLPRTIMIAHHIVYSSQRDIPATWKLSGNVVAGMGSNFNYLAFTWWVTEKTQRFTPIEILFCGVLKQ